MAINKTKWGALACGLCCALCVALYLASVRGEVDAAEPRRLSATGAIRWKCAWPSATWRRARWWTPRPSSRRCGWPIFCPTLP